MQNVMCKIKGAFRILPLRLSVHQLALTIAIVLECPHLAWSQALVERLSPPVLQRGTVNHLQVFGSETSQALGLWTSLPDGTCQVQSISNLEPSPILEVELSREAPLGVYGLRLVTRSGLSNIHLFMVDELPVVVRDPNLAADASVSVMLPVSVTSICRPAAVDRYSITVAKNQLVAFEVVGNRLGKDYDPLVRIRNARHKIVAECDNSVGLLFDCRFAHRFTESGIYTVEIRDARFEGHPTWNYVLRMGDFPAARSSIPAAARVGTTTILSFPQIPGATFPMSIDDGAILGDAYKEIRLSQNDLAAWIPMTLTDLPIQLETEPNNTTETSTSVTVPAVLNGYFDCPGDRDWYAFDLTKDQKLTFQGVSRLIGGAADLELVLYDSDNREVRRVDDNELEEGGFAFTAGKTGTHRLQVRELSRDGGPEFVYRIDVRSGGPQFQLLAEVPDLTLPRGTYQSLPIKITRTDFNGEIELELLGSPPGITLEPSVIPTNAVEYTGRIIGAPTALEGVGTLRIRGKATLENGTVIQAFARTKPLIDRQRKNVDLIPYALREDQRHLPPSITDRIALNIVPATPFTVELPESLVQLTRFQTAEFPIVTTRQPGFVEPITFIVNGGQIGDEREERNQVYARFKAATTDNPSTVGTFYNRINTQLNKHRVDLTASAVVDGHRVNLVRAFTLNVRSAFQPTCEPEVPTAEPGGTVRVKIVANRASSFDGTVRFTLGPNSGFVFPTTVTIPAGQPSAEFDVKIDSKLNPGRHGIRMEVAGFVGKYEESFNLPNLPIEVKKATP